MNWLLTEILTGFQKLLCLSLENTPASELLRGTAQTWVECLADGRQWDEQRDAARVRQAFVVLARNQRRWPAPRDFLDALPKVEQHLALPARPTDPQRSLAYIEEARSILQGDRKSAAAGGDA